jgi:hypothetical protein
VVDDRRRYSLLEAGIVGVIWKGKDLETYGDVLDAMAAITDRDEAQEFKRAYTEQFPDVADNNLGYLAGYCSNDEMLRIFDLFDVEHPIFGRTIPTSLEALRAGFDLARKREEADRAT